MLLNQIQCLIFGDDSQELLHQIHSNNITIVFIESSMTSSST